MSKQQRHNTQHSRHLKSPGGEMAGWCSICRLKKEKTVRNDFIIHSTTKHVAIHDVVTEGTIMVFMFQREVIK